MRRVGLIGGMSWESSALDYRLLNERVRDRLGGLHSADCVLGSVDFAQIERMQVAGAWDDAGEVLVREAVADRVEAAVAIPLLHLGDITARAAVDAGLDTVGLLGTAFTMEQDFYRDRVARHGLRVLVPDAAQRAVVHRIIYDELVLGVVREESRDAYRRVVGSLVERGAQGVVLGCTEIELLLTDDTESGVPLLPTTRLHVAAAVAWSLDG